MNVGDKVTRIPHFLMGHEQSPMRETAKPLTGTVVYIHPQMRYYTVEFNLGLWKVRESYTK